MQFRNKQTGEIVSSAGFVMNKEPYTHILDDPGLSVKELNELWEDYEEDDE